MPDPSDEILHIADDGDLRKYRTEIPNLIFDALRGDTAAMQLYVHMKRIAGPEGQCYLSLRRLAEIIGFSYETVRRRLDLLKSEGFIREVGKRTVFGGQVRVFVVADVWLQNMQHFAHRRVTPSRRSGPPLVTPSEEEKALRVLAKFASRQKRVTPSVTHVKNQHVKNLTNVRALNVDEELATELADTLRDLKSKNFYRKLTTLYSYYEMRAALGDVVEDMRAGKNVRNAGALFSFWLKKRYGKRW